MEIRKTFIFSILLFVFGTVSAKHPQVKQTLTLKAIGNGEKVRLSIGGKSKIVTLEGTKIGEFIAGGDPPYRYTTLLSVQKGASFYLVAKFRSGSPISDPYAPCGGDRPTTLVFIKTDKNLTPEVIQTEIIESCAYNGFGRYMPGPMQVTKNKVSVLFDEGKKKYALIFDDGEAEKGLQLIDRSTLSL